MTGFLTLQQLNDDCILHISLFLPTYCDRLALADATGRIDIMRRDDLLLNLFETPLRDEQLVFLFKRLAKNLVTLRIKGATSHQMLLLVQYRFPRIHDFRFAQLISTANSEEPFNDESLFIESFPNLRTFSPHGGFTGKYFHLFQHLEHLTLTYCNQLSATNLFVVLDKLRLKSLKLDVLERKTLEKKFNTTAPVLENLIANAYEFYLLRYGRNIPCLKKISITERNYLKSSKILSRICSFNNYRIVNLTMSILLELPVNVFMPKLLSLTFVNDCKISDIVELYKVAPTLSKLNFFYCTISASDLINLLATPNELQEINFQSCELKTNSQLYLNWFQNSQQDHFITLNIWPFADFSVLPQQESDKDLARLTFHPTDLHDYEPLVITMITNEICI